jgi:hypothetical protein
MPPIATRRSSSPAWHNAGAGNEIGRDSDYIGLIDLPCAFDPDSEGPLYADTDESAVGVREGETLAGRTPMMRR